MTGNANPSGPARRGQGGPDERLHSRSAERNAEPIGALLGRVAPTSGRAVEIASGTGQHVHAFASICTDLDWQPTDIDPARLASIAAWTAGLPNVRPPIAFNAVSDAWPGPPTDLILLVNLLHLIPAHDAWNVVRTIAAGLAPGGTAVVYGPFLRDNGFASEADARFDSSLKAQDPAIGYKSVGQFRGWTSRAGLEIVEVAHMPANNLALVLRNSGNRGAPGEPPSV